VLKLVTKRTSIPKEQTTFIIEGTKCANCTWYSVHDGLCHHCGYTGGKKFQHTPPNGAAEVDD